MSEGEIEMNPITEETRRESWEEIQRNGKGESLRNKILQALKEHGRMTVRECALAIGLHSRGDIHPRMTELTDLKLVSVVGTAKDPVTKRTVSVYELAKKEKEICLIKQS